MATVSYKGSSFNIGRILAKSSSSPVIQITLDDLCDDAEIIDRVVYSSYDPKVAKGRVIVTPHEGKYVPLTGIENLPKDLRQFDAVLISKVALKACKI